MSWVAAAIGGSAVLGFLGSQNAADAQSQSSAAGIGEQRRQFDLNRSDLAPYRSAGQSALSALLMRLGLSPSSGSMTAPDRAAFTTRGTPGGYTNTGFGSQGESIWKPTTPDTFDQAGFDKATADFNASQGASKDPNFGSLLKPFTGADLQNEPGYQFGLTEGEKAINNLAATRGNYFSGGTGKALTRYSQDYAGTKYNDAYNRDAADKTRTANLLSGVAGTGQQAVNTGVAAGTSGSNAIADLMTQGGNAAASGYVGGANAINNGVGNYVNWTNQGRTLDLLRSPTFGRTSPTAGYSSQG